LPAVIVVNNGLGDLFNAAHAKPGDLTLASAGPASGFHIAGSPITANPQLDVGSRGDRRLFREKAVTFAVTA
jgi:hypothetical protein